jgi:hypothetical protein
MQRRVKVPSSGIVCGFGLIEWIHMLVCLVCLEDVECII